MPVNFAVDAELCLSIQTDGFQLRSYDDTRIHISRTRQSIYWHG